MQTKSALRTRRIGGEGSGAWAVHERGLRRLAAGEDIVILSVGDPNFDTPPPIVVAAVASLHAGRTHYSNPGGEPVLRDALARYFSRFVGRQLDGADVVYFPGAQNALFAVCLCLLEHGDEVLVPEPTYVSYQGVIGVSGATMVPVPLPPERGFHLRAADVEARITANTRALLLNNPHNPTGASLTGEEVAEIGEVCRRHGLWLIADEVYASMTYDRPHGSALALPGLDDRFAVVSSLSKSHAMTGWRAGWAVAPPALATDLVNLSYYMLDGCQPFIEDAVRFAVSENLPEVESMRQAYVQRATILVEGLSSVPGISCHPPEAGIFLLADIRGTGLSGEEFANRLLDEADVAVFPGEAFGPSAAGHVRVSLAVDEDQLREATRRIGNFVESLGATKGAD